MIRVMVEEWWASLNDKSEIASQFYPSTVSRVVFPAWNFSCKSHVQVENGRKEKTYEEKSACMNIFCQYLSALVISGPQSLH